MCRVCESVRRHESPDAGYPRHGTPVRVREEAPFRNMRCLEGVVGELRIAKEKFRVRVY
jgi:hypothetical protein